MNIAHLNKEEKLNLIISTLKNEIIEKAENQFKAIAICKELKVEAIKTLIDKTINLEYVTDFILFGRNLRNVCASYMLIQDIKIEMTVEGLLDKITYETMMSYEPSIEIINEYLHKHRLDKIKKE